MARYLVIIEDSGPNLSAYVPDLPGCVATGQTRQELLDNMKTAIDAHIASILEDGGQGPQVTHPIGPTVSPTPSKRVPTHLNSHPARGPIMSSPFLTSHRSIL